MTTLVNSPTIGMQRVAREALVVLLETLNDELPAQDARWADLDTELATMRGVDTASAEYQPIVLEPVEPQNFYLGFQPSLINAEVEKYPNVSVTADRAGSAAIDNTDHMDNYRLRLVVEMMVKSLASEEEVNARIQRMADAVNICMMSNKTLRGTVHGFEGTPSAQISEVFVRREKTAYGANWFWQGARIEYAVTKEASLPQGAFSRPAESGAPSLVGLNIDQS